MGEDRSLILRCNRFLGYFLINNQLVSSEDLEVANEKLIKYIQKSNFKQASLLNILFNEQSVLKEDDFLAYTLNKGKIGLADLSHYKKVLFDSRVEINNIDCWATRTVLFDKIDDFYFLATAYYFSQPVHQYWMERIPGKILWYTSPLHAINEAIEDRQTKLLSASQLNTTVI